MATTSGITTLDSTYTSLINYQIQVESQPLTTLQAQQSTLKLQRAVYTDLKTKLDALRTSTKNLISTNPFYSLNAGRTVSVENVSADSKVITAAASKSAIPSSYEITNISLALADRVRSDEQEYSDQALSKEGTIYIGGTADRTAVKGFQAVNSFGTAESTTKLTDGTYFIETREEEGTWQFRLVNSSGTAQTIDGSGLEGWQAIVAGTKDTGRGLTIDFGSDPAKYVAADKSSALSASVIFSSQDEVISISSSLNTVSSIVTDTEIAAGQLELGTGKYYVETQQNTDNQWQFRLVDSEGNAAKIRVGTSDSFSAGWQAIPTTDGAYSTGRGLSIDFGNEPSKYVAKTKLGGATSFDYQSKGAAIEVTADMSLNDIATKISSAKYAAGDEVTATVVNKQLVLSSKLTGLLHKIQASGEVLQELGVLSGSSFKNVMQEARNASFKVNGLSVTRTQNAALTDVISGVTLNLAADAEGKSATLMIASDISASKAAINSLLTNFNSTQAYLSSKLSLTKQADGTYLRGTLSGDQSLQNLRSSLFALFNNYDSSGGLYKSLKEIGIGLSSSLTASVTDSSKLEKALTENFDAVQEVVDRVMTNINEKLDRFTGTTSYVDQMIKATDSKTTNVSTQIDTWNKRIEQRKVTLTAQYVEMQSQMDLLTNTQNTNTAWINSLYSSINSNS